MKMPHQYQSFVLVNGEETAITDSYSEFAEWITDIILSNEKVATHTTWEDEHNQIIVRLV